MPAGAARLGWSDQAQESRAEELPLRPEPRRRFGGSWCQPLLQSSSAATGQWPKARVLERERAWGGKGLGKGEGMGSWPCPTGDPGDCKHRGLPVSASSGARGAQLPHPGFPVHREGTSLARNSPWSWCLPRACSKWKEEGSNVVFTVLRNAGNEWEFLVARVCFFDCVRLDHVGGELWILCIIRKTTQF